MAFLKAEGININKARSFHALLTENLLTRSPYETVKANDNTYTAFISRNEKAKCMKPFLVAKLETQDSNEMLLIVSISYHVFCNEFYVKLYSCK